MRDKDSNGERLSNPAQLFLTALSPSVPLSQVRVVVEHFVAATPRSRYISVDPNFLLALLDRLETS